MTPDRSLRRAHTAINIANAAVEHAPGIAAVHISSWRAAYADIFDADFLKRLSVEDRAQRWREILQKAESQTLVACQDDKLVGFVSFGKCRDEGSADAHGEIWALYAQPEFWGQGVGRKLLGQAIQEMRLIGRSVVLLWVLSQNLRGLEFYQAFGFKRVDGSEKLFELGGRQVEEVCLRLEIDA